MNRNRWRHHRPLFSSPAPREVEKPRIRWRILPFIWTGLKRTCTVLGAFMLFSMTLGLISTYSVMQKTAPPLPDRMVLYLDFAEGMSELPQSASFVDPFAMGAPTLRELIGAIQKAKHDNRVWGIFARIDEGGFSLAHVQEIRAAIKDFRESGKFTYVYSSSYGDEAGGFGGYYLASAFEEIWMQPMGVVAIPGLNAEIPFVKDALDKIGVQGQFFQRKEYKTAYESMTNSHMSDANRHMTTRMINDIRQTLSKDISADRGFAPGRFDTLVNKGLFTARESVQSGLVDKADYADVLVDSIIGQVTGDPESDEAVFIDLQYYISDLEKGKELQVLKEKLDASHKPEVALIYAAGMIMPSAGGGAPPGFGDGGIAAADEIAPAILDAADDPLIEAIVLRIDSPGGSPTASESILRALERAQKKGKPVIVSMGPTAASGGYWIAAYADMIFAVPSTLTGSIGVVGGKFVMKDLWEKIGVNWESVKWGENAALLSFNTPFSESEAERFNATLDQIYEGFVSRVAFGRGMTKEQVEKIARGQVWTGAEAVKIGLVDEIGGLDEALVFTAQLLGAEGKDGINIVQMPKPLTPLDQLIALLEGQTSVIEGMRWQNALMQNFAPFMREAAMMQRPELYTTYQPLKLP